MASITIRNLDESLKSRLKRRAATHGRSMADEAHDILRSALDREAPTPGNFEPSNVEPSNVKPGALEPSNLEPANLADTIRARFAPLGGFDMPSLARDPIREGAIL